MVNLMPFVVSTKLSVFQYVALSGVMHTWVFPSHALPPQNPFFLRFEFALSSKKSAIVTGVREIFPKSCATLSKATEVWPCSSTHNLFCHPSCWSEAIMYERPFSVSPFTMSSVTGAPAPYFSSSSLGGSLAELPRARCVLHEEAARKV